MDRIRDAGLSFLFTYVAIFNQIRWRPIIFERERVNFDDRGAGE